ncbi:hypothetical protein PENSPDRAFT_686951 [Peniophora sp. CONT]|nr:hypothetical protein PENSPDRAFT_686951 [Peniophora sp. CONT]
MAAAVEKEKAPFKAGDYAGAVGHYSAAIVADAADPTLPLNRAAAYLKLNKNEDAQRDCTRVIFLSGATPNVKALFRRAQARIALQRLSDAQQDLRDAQKIDPKNDAVKTELTRVASLLEKGKARAQSRTPIDVPAPPLSATGPPKRRRVPIKIVEPATAPATSSGASSKLVSYATNSTKQPIAATKTTSAPTSSDLLSAVSSRPLTSSSPAPKSSSSSVDPPPKLVPASIPASNGTRNGDAKRAPVRAGGGIFRSSGDHTVVPEKEVAATTSSTATPSKAPAASSSAKCEPLPAPAPPGGDAKLPWTLFAFVRNWDALNTPEDRWALLSKVPPSALSNLYQTSLEPSHIVSVLRVFQVLLTTPAHEDQREDIKTWIKDYLNGYTRVQRFGTITLFMSTEERKLVKDVLVKAGVAEGGDLWRKWL